MTIRGSETGKGTAWVRSCALPGGRQSGMFPDRCRTFGKLVQQQLSQTPSLRTTLCTGLRPSANSMSAWPTSLNSGCWRDPGAGRTQSLPSPPQSFFSTTVAVSISAEDGSGFLGQQQPQSRLQPSVTCLITAPQRLGFCPVGC